jgi:hypothetical protein
MICDCSTARTGSSLDRSGENAQYLDLWPALADDAGDLRREYTEDGLHLNGPGYAAWVGVLRAARGRVLGRTRPCDGNPAAGHLWLPSRSVDLPRSASTYYLVNSSFEYAPGVPVFRSADLREWEQIGNVLDRPSQLDVSGAGPSGGVFAPSPAPSRRAGSGWSPRTGPTTAGSCCARRRPGRPWSEPVRIPSAVGIDPDLAWDDDGTCLMSYAGFGPRVVEGSSSRRSTRSPARC